jgi:hypothetical protein
MEHRKTFDVVRFYDPAIDWRASSCEPVAYASERKLERLVMRAGHAPTLFRYQRITRPAWLKFVSRGATDEERRVRSFQAGVVEVHAPDGRVWKPGDIDRPDYVAMSEADLDALEQHYGVGIADLQEIGEVVRLRSELPFECEPLFPVLPSSLAVWRAASLRSVARSLTAAAQSSTAPAARSAAPETSPAPSGASSASRSDAPATDGRTKRRDKRR